MYEEFTTEDENHRILKKQCHGGDDLYRAGHHFTSDLLSLSAFTRHDSGNVTGKTLLAQGKLMLQNTKKAMAKIRYLKGKVVHLNPRGEIIAYASGKNETDVMRMINDGMYMDHVKSKEAPVIDVDASAAPVGAGARAEDGSNNSLLGVENDTALESNTVIEFTEEELQQMATFEAEEGGEEEFDDASSRLVVDEEFVPFGGVAPKSWRFPGYITFLCFGPHTEYLSILLTTKGNGEKDKDTSGRSHQRKEMAKRDSARRNNGTDRGMSIQTKVQIASVAQNEVGAEMRENEGMFATITARIHTKQSICDRKVKMAQIITNEKKVEKLFEEIEEIEKEIADLDKELEQLSRKKRKTNSIAQTVLEQAAKVMGIGPDASASSNTSSNTQQKASASSNTQQNDMWNNYDNTHGNKHPNNAHLTAQGNALVTVPQGPHPCCYHKVGMCSNQSMSKLDLCATCKREDNKLHHMCQAAAEFAHGLTDRGLIKQCYDCNEDLKKKIQKS
jgi:hypothetical protein